MGNRVRHRALNSRLLMVLLLVVVAPSPVAQTMRITINDLGIERPVLALPVLPGALVAVTAENRNTPVSTAYTLGEFVAKQTGGYPKYLVLRPRLLLKLELIADALRDHGVEFRKFTIMSGYRTPYYNRSIGNAQFSRHVWGGAADIYIDESPQDGVMDDLDGDGRITKADALWLWRFIDDLAKRGRFGELIGGLGLYGATAAHGPFVHVDVRGFVARW